MHPKRTHPPPLYARHNAAPVKSCCPCGQPLRAESFCRSTLRWRDLANSASNSSGDISPPSAVGAVAAAGAVDAIGRLLNACRISIRRSNLSAVGLIGTAVESLARVGPRAVPRLGRRQGHAGGGRPWLDDPMRFYGGRWWACLWWPWRASRPACESSLASPGVRLQGHDSACAAWPWQSFGLCRRLRVGGSYSCRLP